MHHHVRIYPWALKAIFGSIAWCGHISGFLSRTITPCDLLALELGVRYLVFACARFLKVSEGQSRCFFASRILQFHKVDIARPSLACGILQRDLVHQLQSLINNKNRSITLNEMAASLGLKGAFALGFDGELREALVILIPDRIRVLH